jgi:hypothetical protein
MFPIPNGFRDRDILLYGSEIVDKKEVIRTVSNNCIYCLSDKVGTVSHHQHPMHCATRLKTWRIARLSAS